jgi:integrase
MTYYHRGKEVPGKTTKTKKEAEAKKILRKTVDALRAGKLVLGEDAVTFNSLATDLENDYKVNNRRSPIAYPINRLKKTFDGWKAIEINTASIKEHILKRQEQGASNATINRELAALKRMFALAVQAGKLSSKPYIPTLEEHNARQGFLDHAAFLVLRDKLPDHLKDPVTFLYLSGWRVSEMRKLEWRDVDLAGKVVRLRPEISKNKDGRVLPIGGDLLEVIERAKQRRVLSCPYVFHEDSQPVGNFRKAWKTACVAAGLGKLVKVGEKKKRYTGLIVHDLRRSAVRNMVRAGIPERVAMSLTGHKTRGVFERYNIVSESDLAQATEKLQVYLREQPKNPAVAPMRAVS